MDLRPILTAELSQRRQRNHRYSLRAFARDLGTDHATLSQILRGRRTLAPRMIRRFGARLRLGHSDIAEACAWETARVVHRLAGLPGFRTDSRWIAMRTGLSIDGVNTALQRLLRCRELTMPAPNRWVVSPAYA